MFKLFLLINTSLASFLASLGLQCTHVRPLHVVHRSLKLYISSIFFCLFFFRRACLLICCHHLLRILMFLKCSCTQLSDCHSGIELFAPRFLYRLHLSVALSIHMRHIFSIIYKYFLLILSPYISLSL